jgi:hypothetical protein
MTARDVLSLKSPSLLSYWRGRGSAVRSNIETAPLTHLAASQRSGPGAQWMRPDPPMHTTGRDLPPASSTDGADGRCRDSNGRNRCAPAFVGE